MPNTPEFIDMHAAYNCVDDETAFSSFLGALGEEEPQRDILLPHSWDAVPALASTPAVINSSHAAVPSWYAPDGTAHGHAEFPAQASEQLPNVEDAKQERIRAKNRRNQKAYRARVQVLSTSLLLEACCNWYVRRVTSSARVIHRPMICGFI